MARPKPLALVWTAPHQRPKTVHDIVERVLSKYYPHLEHDICPRCTGCLTCDNPHLCVSAMAKAA